MNGYMNKPEKNCLHCGRSFEYRKKWAKNWDEVKFCSDRCRSVGRGVGKKQSENLQAQIMELLKVRGPGKTICPSEVLQAGDKHDPILMESVRQAARLLTHEGLIEITQKGKTVDPSNFRGPIRLRLRS